MCQAARSRCLTRRPIPCRRVQPPHGRSKGAERAAAAARDLGRLDFRVGPDGRVHFIEANALPSLEPGAGLYASAALSGLLAQH